MAPTVWIIYQLQAWSPANEGQRDGDEKTLGSILPAATRAEHHIWTNPDPDFVSEDNMPRGFLGVMTFWVSSQWLLCPWPTTDSRYARWTQAGGNTLIFKTWDNWQESQKVSDVDWHTLCYVFTRFFKETESLYSHQQHARQFLVANRARQLSVHPPCPLWVTQPNHIAQNLIQSNSESPQGRTVQNCPEQPTPVLKHPPGEERFP